MDEGVGSHLLLLGAAGALLALNGFFVAAEFALVKMRSSRVDTLVGENIRFSKTLLWHTDRLDASLAACQLGITLASLGLGWIGEPALAGLLERPFHYIGLGSPVVIHTVSFIIAFSLFTALHITIGEQVPKIYAIRRPEPIALVCAWPLKLFYLGSYPFLVLLNATSNAILRRLGMSAGGGHDEPPTEDEIRHLLTESRLAGELTKSEHKLMNAVFDFDDLVARQIMIPRKDLVAFDLNRGVKEFLELVAKTLHSRYPVYDASADNIVGLLHVKDFAGRRAEDVSNLRDHIRSIEQVPESMSITSLLAKLQSSKVHMTLVADEYGSIVGAVTLEDILERLVGNIQDEFDSEPELIRKDGVGKFLVSGLTPIELVNRSIGVYLHHDSADTISGFIVDTLDRNPVIGDVVELGDDFRAEVLNVDGPRAIEIKIVKVKA